MSIAKPFEAGYLRRKGPEVTRRALMAGAAGVTGLSCLADMALAYSQAAAGTRRSGTPKADRPRSGMKISSVKVTRVASPDRPIMNSTSSHATHFVRTITEIETSDGHRGVSEVGRRHAEKIEAARSVVLGRDPFELEYFRRNIEDYEAFAGIEIACLDLIGRALNRRVCDLIGGAFREAAPYSAYVFFVLPTDEEAGVITAEAAAQQFVDFNRNEGFRSCKFKGGVLKPDEEIEALKIMRRRVPDAKLRIDPNAAWTVETSKRVPGRWRRQSAFGIITCEGGRAARHGVSRGSDARPGRHGRGAQTHTDSAGDEHVRDATGAHRAGVSQGCDRHRVTRCSSHGRVEQCPTLGRDVRIARVGLLGAQQ